MDDRFNHLSEGVLTLNASGTIAEVNAPAARLLGREPANLRGVHVADAIPEAPQPQVASADAWVNGDVAFVEYFPTLDCWLAVRSVQTDQGPTVYLGDVTDRERQRRDLESRRAEVRTLAQITATISDILAELVDASSREEIEWTLCEHLHDADLYQFAWIAEPVVGEAGVTVLASAGANDVLEQLRDGFGGEPPSPEQRALETGEVQLVTGLADAGSAPKPIGRAAFAQGLYSCVAIPITYGSTVYGVLGIYTDRQDALTDRERGSYATLGRVTGFAIHATHQRRLVLSDTVVELTHQIADPSAPLITASSALGDTLAVEGVVPIGEGELLAYVSLTDATAADLGGYLEPETLTRPIQDEAGDLVEVRLGGRSPLTVLANLGTTLRAATFEDGTAEVVAETAPETDIRKLNRRLEEMFDTVEMTSKREQERSVETAGEFRRALRDRLTDRQLTVLRTAYLADYFESPRGSTSEEVAKSLDITGPTLLHHLRAAERKLLEAFFEDLDPGRHFIETADDAENG
jgi:PAS domain-containing protein